MAVCGAVVRVSWVPQELGCLAGLPRPHSPTDLGFKGVAVTVLGGTPGHDQGESEASGTQGPPARPDPRLFSAQDTKLTYSGPLLCFIIAMNNRNLKLRIQYHFTLPWENEILRYKSNKIMDLYAKTATF